MRTDDRDPSMDEVQATGTCDDLLLAGVPILARVLRRRGRVEPGRVVGREEALPML
jgi:hypothetical protein